MRNFKVCGLMIGLGMSLMLSACGAKSETASIEDQTSSVSTEATTEADTGMSREDIASEIERLVNSDIPSISEERDKAVEIYNAYFLPDSQIDSEAWLKQLEETAITSYDSYLQKLGDFTYESPEAESLRNTFLTSSRYQRDAIMDVINGVRNMDSTCFDSANEKLAQSKTYLSAFQDSLKTICNEYNIEISSEASISTETQ